MLMTCNDSFPYIDDSKVGKEEDRSFYNAFNQSSQQSQKIDYRLYDDVKSLVNENDWNVEIENNGTFYF